eukprot:TRINITY_DN3253_c0_g1_i1.p1 TRINITY_DN3253_c0_g1~~TRINITY_DN3253_c0_g1_i1.p1  ORF type:complete len:503 (+),score=95.86 TRINITY_DN3253_c0_g1_i1:28-1509(+)
MPQSVSIQAGSKQIALNTGLFINGAFVEAQSGKTFATINPATEALLANVAEGDKVDVDLAVAAAKQAFSTWSILDPRDRAAWLSKLAIAIQHRIKDFAHLEAADNGKTVSSATMDVDGVVKVFQYYAGWADKISGRSYILDQSQFEFTAREPIGVCGAIIPWNYPLSMLAWKVAPALACGNTIVVKTSEKTPLSALLFAQICQEIQLPKGIVNIISGFGHTAGAALASHRDVDKIAFTGSTATGRVIAKLAADSNLKKVSLELGGKSPNIIFDDADLEEAIKWAVIGIFANHGQVCCAGSRIFVQEGIYDAFIQGFTAAAKAWKVGDQFATDTMQGPQVDDIQFKRILGYIDAGKAQGAQLTTGGTRVGTKGYFIAPTILTNVQDEHTVAREEIFGPVACVFKFRTEPEVIERANATNYGLAAAVFTRDVSRALRVQRQLKAGTVWVNQYNMVDNRLPFGGYKESGYGRELGEYALDLYTQIKTVRVNLASKL